MHLGEIHGLPKTLGIPTQLNAKGNRLGNQPASNELCSGSITANGLEADARSIVGVGSTTGRKIKVCAEGDRNIMGDTRI